MKRSERVGTVVRVREIQEQLAETEAVRRRRDADDRRAEAVQAHADVDARSAIGGGSALSFTELARRRTVIDAAVAAAEHRDVVAEHADEALDLARAAWLGAHRRHDAVDRLLGRTQIAERADEARRVQAELDDVVAARHRRAPVEEPR